LGGRLVSSDALVALAIKGLLGGGLVVAFSLLAEAVRPKSFAGLFGAAPSIAVAGLAVTLVLKGSHEARLQSLGMILGSVAFVIAALVATGLLTKMSALETSLLSWAAWILAASGLYVLLLR